MKPLVDYTLYLVTDRDLMHASTVEESVKLAIAGGVTFVQLREKAVSSLEFYETAIRVKNITDRYNVPLVINDRLDIALAVGADGVHIGQSDLPAKIVRRILGNDKLVGVSVSNVEKAKKAVKDGADYLGVGALFSTQTKKDTQSVSSEELYRIRDAVSIPLVGIGGLTTQTVPKLKKDSLDGIAVVSAIVAQENIAIAAKNLKTIFNKTKEGFYEH